MNAELKQKWIAALRSGDYEQARFDLVDRDRDGAVSYCCLGVLLCITGTRRPPQMVESHSSDYGYIEDLLGGSNVRLALVDLNDYKRANFSHIADYIERAL
jgi:hypothetical protein